MRTMNLPPFAGKPVRIADLGEYLKTRLAVDTVPWPDHSWRLLAHMAWPNDAARRNLWMAAQIGMQLEPEAQCSDLLLSAAGAFAHVPRALAERRNLLAIRKLQHRDWCRHRNLIKSVQHKP